ncbi:trifunctional histidinol dehydrogenase [Tilletia horrida]|uniref:Histidine biosynthesis trifunctional protein n=1 Tax=Tilletia horrida TaxID=155126 RepID=A0AAN6JLQ9_9BASI|nr:trifunctional histidinol dehydrogenase [Tilletia horrida]KAK0537192.1 trifunctional histidinol dehydrogenase [Tilletia horrida]KAK0558538.1 trifunctional histidinol dehydrogenase [Tilletia horrida]
MVLSTSPLLPVLAAGEALPSGSSSQLWSAIGRTSTPVVLPLETVSSAASASALPPSYIVALPSGAVIDPASAVTLLNNGAEALLSDNPDLLITELGLPADRIVLSVTTETATPVAELAASIAGVLITLPDSMPVSDAQAAQIVAQYTALLDVKNTGKPVYVQTLSQQAPTVEDVKILAAQQATLVVPYAALSIAEEESAASSASLDFASAFFSPLTSDRSDGLFPTLVVAAPSASSLGLVYSSLPSLRACLLTGDATYQSRTRGLWRKGATSGATQQVVRVRVDCDSDAIEITVRQRQGTGFCHLAKTRTSCFGAREGLAKLEETLLARAQDAPEGSYTQRLFREPELLAAKLREETAELIEANDSDPEHVAFEAADLLYFALVRCVRAGVGLEDIERSLDAKARKVSRRKGDAKAQFVVPAPVEKAAASEAAPIKAPAPQPAQAAEVDDSAPIKINSYTADKLSPEERVKLQQRPAIGSSSILSIVQPILADVKARGDQALIELTRKFDRAELKDGKVTMLPPFDTPERLQGMKPEVKEAINVAYKNIYAFHKAQKVTAGNRSAKDAGLAATNSAAKEEEEAVLEMETMPGILCRRFSRPIQRVGLYVPGGTAVLPSTALMLGIPAQVAGCPTIVLATPPRSDGSVAPEVLYVASLVGASCVLLAGGAQAVGALAYGTASVPKVDKIAGPGNQFVTAAKMCVQNDVAAQVSIDMPAGPSEVLVIADEHAPPSFVAADLLSQAEHGPDSQVVLVGIALTPARLQEIEAEVDRQARALPRCNVIRKAIEKSVTVLVNTREEAIRWSNEYAPEHLILQVQDAEAIVKDVTNAGSVFVGPWSPESCGDYASGTNHTLPTYGFARQYSGVSTSTFEKHITSQSLTADGLRALGPHVVHLAQCEGLDAHAEAVAIRLRELEAGLAKDGRKALDL